MPKYAAATALAIALISMLALAVSASLTPANAMGGGYCDNVVCLCQRKCNSNLNASARYMHCRWTHCNSLTAFRDIEACIASCGRMEGVEHLSQSALWARLNASEAAQH
jgi:hypothetical protein